MSFVAAVLSSAPKRRLRTDKSFSQNNVLTNFLLVHHSERRFLLLSFVAAATRTPPHTDALKVAYPLLPVIFEIITFLLQKYMTVMVTVIFGKKSQEFQDGTCKLLGIFWTILFRLQAAPSPNATAKTPILQCSKSVVRFQGTGIKMPNFAVFSVML